MDTQRKLELLADASRYDLSCAACSTKDDHRQRSADGTWIYPVSLPGGGKSLMMKTLMTNACVNDCRYCPFRSDSDVRRCTLGPEEVVDVFLDYVRRRNLQGLFLSSGVARDADHTMDRMIAAAELLRKKHGYRGYIHLKILPGASRGAIDRAVSLASAVSLNVEAPKRSAFVQLSQRKDYDRDIVDSIKYISRLTARASRYQRVRQTTQFIVGAADETDRDLVAATFGLYRRWQLNRVYFSAYQRGEGDPNLPGDPRKLNASEQLTREHRLYQADFLVRQYKWDMNDIVFDPDGSLSLTTDPKQRWADGHPEYFPVRLKRATLDQLLRVPGIGPVTARRMMQCRREGRAAALADLGLRGKRLALAGRYVIAE